ncbi:MAG: hypothetical protein DME61_07520 [Verrucomicrobia bacterium]|nr:MAG: hypothetical protein DME61_07520 [Verrucomicrobiota bacterium]
MPSVVFLRAASVGKTNRCQPASIAKQLAKFGVLNIGAVGTFVVREDASEAALRAAPARKLPFKCEMMICPARDIIKLASKDPFSSHSARDDDWLVKIIAIQDRFVLGLYRRQMKAISYPRRYRRM